MNVLHLTLKKQWFDMIKSGEKTEEYREIKPYWTKRLSRTGVEKPFIPKKFDIVEFKNGYGQFVPAMQVAIKSMKVGFGNFDWGAPVELVYIIELGDVLREYMPPEKKPDIKW